MASVLWDRSFQEKWPEFKNIMVEKEDCKSNLED